MSINFLPGHEGKQHVERSMLNGKILTLHFTKGGCEAVGWIKVAQDRLQVWLFLNLQRTYDFNCDQFKDCYFHKKISMSRHSNSNDTNVAELVSNFLVSASI